MASMSQKAPSSSTSAVEFQASFTRPPEWSDEERMNFLLAPFPLNKNPPPNDPKIIFWSSLVINSSRELKKPLFTERELLCRLKWKQTTSPSCLSVVIQTMENAGTIMKLSTFSQAAASGESWLTWGLSIAMKPVSWALKNYLPLSQYDGEYIINALIKEYASAVVAEHEKAVIYKTTDNLMKFNAFENLCQRVVIAAEEVHPIIGFHLMKEGKICRRGEVVKFVSNQKRAEVTDIDIGIVGIMETIESLLTQIQSMEEKSVRLKQLARDKVRANDRQGALNHLRRNKVIREYIHKREALLDNVQNILHQIQSAETDSMVFKAYKDGATAIKSLREAEGLTIDSAEEAIFSLKEAVQDSEEITIALSTANENEDQDSDEELELELLALLSPEKGNAAQPSHSKATPSIDDALIDQLSSLRVSGHNTEDTCDKQPRTEAEIKSNTREKKVLLPA